MTDVLVNLKNYSKCLCPVCPVQTGSGCIEAKKGEWLTARQGMGRVLKQYHVHPEAYEMEMGGLEQSEVGQSQQFKKPTPEAMLELYCSPEVDKSNCNDLDGDKACQCPDCEVWSAHRLSGRYYCLTGKSK